MLGLTASDALTIGFIFDITLSSPSPLNLKRPTRSDDFEDNKAQVCHCTVEEKYLKTWECSDVL